MNRKHFIKPYKDKPVTVKASFWSFFCNAMQKGTLMLTIPIITRMLSTADYGRYSVFVSYSSILLIFGTLSLSGNGYYVGMKRYSWDRDRYTSSMVGIELFLTSVCGIVILTASDWVTKKTGLGAFSCCLAVCYVYGQGAIELWFRENRYEFKYRMIVLCTVFTAIATPLLKIGLIIFFRRTGGDQAIGTILGYVLPVAIVGIVALVIMVSKGRTLFVKEYWLFVFRFNIPLIPYYLSQNILNQADRIMIERLTNASNAGIYSVAYSVASAIAIINLAVNSSFIPWQFQSMQRGDYKRVVKVANLLMLMVAAAHMILIFVAPELMKVFASAEYSEAIYVMPPVTIGVLLIWLTQIFINVEFYYEKNKLIAMSSVMSAILNVVLNYFAIPKFGFLAAGWTTLACYLANMFFHGMVAVRLSRKMEAERPFDLHKIVLLTAGCIGSMFVIMFFYDMVWLRYGMLLFGCALALIKRRKLVVLLHELWTSIR